MNVDKKNGYLRDVYIVDGCRTPWLKARGKPGAFSAADLAVMAGRQLLARQSFAASDLDEVITGCVMPSADEANISRVIALRLGCGVKVPAWTVQRNCASGLQSIDNAANNIANGRSELVLAGGVEAMSRTPMLLNDRMVEWLSRWMTQPHWTKRLALLAKLRPSMFVPIIALLRGLCDPLVGLSMGQTAENLANQFSIARTRMDAFACQSHQRLAAAQDAHFFDEVVSIYDTQGQYYREDDGVRRDCTVEKLAKLKPFFDKRYGQVTAGNSSQITDGAAYLILASADAVSRYQLPVLGKIVDTCWAGVDPSVMGLGPVNAIVPLLQRHALTTADIDYWEINEAFAAQVLACLEAIKDKKYCQAQFALDTPFQPIDEQRLNVDGGGVAMGHPVGASGTRIVLHLLHVLRRNKAKRGIASLCIGGGQGGAMLLESVSEVVK
jgi:acetyl-CoA C-acetyltransferase